MSYETLESANSGSTSLLLFEFTRDRKSWRYNNQDETFDAGGFTWIGEDMPITMDSNRQTGDATQDAVNFEVSSNHPVARLFTNLATSGGIRLTVWRTFSDDLNDMRPYWSGMITDRQMVDPAVYRLTGQVLSYTGGSQGSRLREGRGCTYQLYQQYNTCMVDKELYRVRTRVISMDGSSVTVEAIPLDARSNFYMGGFVEFDFDPDIVERRGIVEQIGTNRMVLLGGTVGMVNNMQVSVFPGCPRDWDHCGSLYGNQDNYGGDPVLPGISPFTTNVFSGG